MGIEKKMVKIAKQRFSDTQLKHRGHM